MGWRKQKRQTARKQPARPEYVGKFGVPSAVFDGVFGGGGAEAVQPENGEKFVPKGVFFGTFALFVLEAAGKLGGKAVFVFVGVGGHGEGLSSGGAVDCLFWQMGVRGNCAVCGSYKQILYN